MEIAEFIPFVQTLFKNPEKSLGKYKGKGDMGDSFKLILIVSFISAIASAINVLRDGLMGEGVVIEASVLVFITSLIFGVVFFFIFSGACYFVSKALGGTGTLGDTIYLFSLVYLLSIISSVASIIPCVGALVSLVVGLYMLYLMGLVLKLVHKFSIIKSAIILIALMVAFGVLLFAFLIILGIALIALGLAAAA
ncbi:MAG: YIP1 family protein [Candidatus Micrarchaeota archaeon]